MQPISWRAVYHDGSLLNQHRGDDTENSYLDIDRARLAAFSLMRDETPIVTIHLEPGQRLIYRRRCFLRCGEPEPIVFYLVGWQRTINGENVQSISVVAEDSGEVNVIGKWRDDHPVFASIEPVDGEEQLIGDAS